MPITLDGTTGITSPAIDLTVTPLTIVDGGTGASTLTSNNVLLGNGTSAVQFVSPSTNGNVLTANGSTWVSSAPAAGGTTIPAGTRMPFQQTTAPTGFTKDTTAAINDSMLRLVTGSASSGGTTAFSTWSAVTATGATTLDTTQIPSHTHTAVSSGATGGLQNVEGNNAAFGNTGATGGGGSHTHSLTRALKYYDFIIATKD